ncbi:cellobiose dehydrogenase [Boeremia exigua]|uniref:cellobiose dehydrogenase n=1 Tax=Boeremia exigua TaxID=749465 RepID=UPI001E8DF220|nr:cellobiose dehydrogenase [Boeremia exigua]KAH6639582.1 cellobiose dehydrogenase [Boeremia exigua]
MIASQILPSFLLAVSSVARAQAHDTVSLRSNDTVPIWNSSYDYIVVGGGASGLIVSERLAETGKSVLVLERGGPSLFSSGGELFTSWNRTLTLYDVPGIFYTMATRTETLKLCTDVPQGAIAGCILGGGTAVNSMQFVRPPSFDFDKWPVGWQWSDVEQSAARQYERNPGSTTPSADGKHYDNGVWDVTSSFFANGGYTQVDTNEDPDKKYKAYSYPALNTEGGFRAGPVRTYLPLAERFPNFKLQLHTKVVRTVRTKSKITGVEVEDTTGKRSIVNINPGGKVILAAGALSSPRILFNSGIGPVDQINIDWIESPVGFVQDHTIVIVTFNAPGGTNVLNQTEFTNPSQELLDLYASGSGPLAQSWNRLMSYSTVTNEDGHKTLWQGHAMGVLNNTVQFMVAITHNSTSTGTLGITSEGNTEWIQSPYLKSASDKEAMTRALDELLAISRLPNSTLAYGGPLNSTGASVLEVAMSGTDPNTTMIPGQHMIGTTIMGTDDGTKNGSSVVDTNCKVYGTDNLFIVDAGMHVDLPTGNTQAIVMVAAEHAAQKIIALDACMSYEICC